MLNAANFIFLLRARAKSEFCNRTSTEAQFVYVLKQFVLRENSVACGVVLLSSINLLGMGLRNFFSFTKRRPQTPSQIGVAFFDKPPRDGFAQFLFLPNKHRPQTPSQIGVSLIKLPIFPWRFIQENNTNLRRCLPAAFA